MSLVRIAHLSDPHFGTVFDPVRASLLTCLAELKLDLCLISGDITQRARSAQFRDARKFKNDLHPLPSFAVPGNHDIPLFNLVGRFLMPYKGFHKYFQTKRETSIALKDVHIFGLNSTSRWRHIQGKLDTQRVREALMKEKNSASVRVVAIHHPLDCHKRIDDKNLLVNREEVLKLFASAEIDLVLSGHIHDPFVTISKIRYPEIQRSIIISVAGTCLSWRTRKGAPNSFNLIEIETGEKATVKLSRFDFDADHTFRLREDCIATFVRHEFGGWVQN